MMHILLCKERFDIIYNIRIAYIQSYISPLNMIWFVAQKEKSDKHIMHLFLSNASTQHSSYQSLVQIIEKEDKSY